MNSEVDDYLKKIFVDNLENEEWELFLLFSLAYHMGWYFRWEWNEQFWFDAYLFDKNDVINFNWITPKWWGYRKTYIYLFSLFKELKITVDIDLNKESIEKFTNLLKDWIYKTDNDLLDRLINKEETNIFFNELLFLFIEHDFYEFFEIKNDFDSNDNIKKIFNIIDDKIANFVNWDLTKKYWVYSFNKQKEVLLDKLSNTQSIHWNMFRISEDNFWDKWNEKSFCYLYFFIFLFRNKYITINEIYSVDEIPIFNEEWKYVSENEKYSFMVYLQPKIIDLINWWINLKELILDKIFNEEYKQITIKKKKWAPYMLESDLSILWDDKRFVELKKLYPYSEIKVDIHNEKINNYKIKERIKLNKIDN